MPFAIIQAAQAQGRTLLSEVEAKALLGAAGLPVTPTQLAASEDEAVQMAESLGYPVVLKVVADSITHKSDVGGVALNLASEADVRASWQQIQDRVKAAAPDAAVQGLSVQPMAKPGTEVIVGLTQDPQFGPVVMFGLGGIFVEVLQDVAFRVVPLEERDAEEMIREIQGFPVLQGYRGSPPADLKALQALLMRLSAFAAGNPDVQELDLNPVFAYDDGALAVDARVVLRAN